MALWMMPPDYESLDEERARKRKAKRGVRAEIFAAVDRRDGMICRACGCRLVLSLARDPKRREHHHIQPLSVGGKDTTENVVNLCRTDHKLTTRHRLAVTGSADGLLTFSAEGRTWTSPVPKVGR